MDFAQLERFLEELGKYLYLAHLYSWGEPLLHPEVAKIIRLVRSHRVSTLISTNLNTRNRGLLKDICDAGLDYLTLSIDGSTQDVYSQYRVGGDLSLVLENIRYIVDYKRKNNLRTPVVEWQYLIFDHNRHEVESAHELANNLGVDIFNANSGIVPEKFHKGWGDCSRCPFLWNSIVLQTDGGISACCNFIDKEDDFGNLSAGSFREIWHAPIYKEARSLFSPKRAQKLPPNLKHPCLYCSLVRIQPHLSDYLKNNIYARFGDGRSVHKDDTIAVRSSSGKEKD
jgi:radical SAM protein with 4Fe4S-binding SPASM domain